MPTEAPHNIVPYLISFGVILVVMALRLRGMSQTRPLRLEWLWVTPAVYLVVTLLALVPQPPQGLDWAWLGAGLALGGALGWWRGKMMHITVDPQTHALNTKASPAALFFLILIIAARVGLRTLAAGESSTLHLSVAVITGAFLTFAVGMFAVQRLEMAMRANRLLTEARAAKAAA